MQEVSTGLGDNILAGWLAPYSSGVSASPFGSSRLGWLATKDEIKRPLQLAAQ